MRILFAATAVLLATTATAQDRPNTILVMDGSGSMWGQIDGVAKITIAQDVVSNLIDTLPADQRLGLMAYGHRERGNCTDIEMLVQPGEDTRDAIKSAVAGIKPLGKTPMTDSIIAAAEALRYTEDSATVILVSDGVETCNPDPCAAARLLEEAGIDFTAHVVGFDVSGDAAALTQMQCLADETGGQFLTAENAAELGAALTAVVAEPEPQLAPVTFTAVLGDDKTVIDTPILWDVNDGTGLVVEDAQGNPLTADLAEGAYVATAYSVAGEETGEAQFVVIAGGNTAVEVMFEAKLPTARIIAPATAPVGSTIQIGWDGPNLDNDYVGVGARDATGAAEWENFVYTRDGNPVDLLMPTEPGIYDIVYFQGADRAQIGTTEITLTPVEGGLTLPESAPVGETIPVPWVGPDYANDYIGIGAPDATGAQQWDNFAYTKDGNPAQLVMPTVPGEYIVRYFFGQNRSVLTEATMTVVENPGSLSAPDSAQAGSTIAVDWTGPDLSGDYIGVGKVDAEGAQRWENFAYTRDGNPAQLVMPTEPGDYVIQYFFGQDRSILTSTPITVTAAAGSITAPDSAVAGSTIDVTWTGPDLQNDYIGIGRVDADGAQRWENFAYTRDGNPSTLLVPTAPGDYLIQYFFGQDRSILTSTPITVTEVTASMTAPATAIAGSTISVDWTGPDYQNDYIGIGQVSADGAQRWENFAYTRDGNPATVLVPTTPGDYNLTYFVGQDRSTLKTAPITVTPVTAQLQAAATAPAGSEYFVAWDGPDYQNDYIAVGRADATGSAQWEAFAYTNAGNPAALTLPETPGDYLVRYFIGQDRSVIAEVPLTIE